MAATASRRRRLTREIGMFFAELGYIPSRRDYMRLSNRPKFLNVKEVDRICGSWPRMLGMLEKNSLRYGNLFTKLPSRKSLP